MSDVDFRNEEINCLKNDADIIITNPPFSLFRKFLTWICEDNKQFLIIGNINCIPYNEVFSKIQRNEIWLGTGMGRWISGFIFPDEYELYGTEASINSEGKKIISTNNCLWLTNLEHGKRHEKRELMTMEDNLKFNKKLIKKLENKFGDKSKYPHYDNYDAIEVPFAEAIPSDYDGIMGVPITFLDKYNPDEFKIIGISGDLAKPIYIKTAKKTGRFYINDIRLYDRIAIQKKKGD